MGAFLSQGEGVASPKFRNRRLAAGLGRTTFVDQTADLGHRLIEFVIGHPNHPELGGYRPLLGRLGQSGLHLLFVVAPTAKPRFCAAGDGASTKISNGLG